MEDKAPPVKSVRSFPPMSDKDRLIAERVFGRQPDGAPFGPMDDRSDEEMLADFDRYGQNGQSKTDNCLGRHP